MAHSLTSLVLHRPQRVELHSPVYRRQRDLEWKHHSGIGTSGQWQQLFVVQELVLTMKSMKNLKETPPHPVVSSLVCRLLLHALHVLHGKFACMADPHVLHGSECPSSSICLPED